MNDKILRKLMDIFRGETHFLHAATISLVLIAWHKASQNPACPAHLQIQNCQGIRPEELVKIMRELSAVMQDEAFNIEDEGISRMRPNTISAGISVCLDMGKSGLLAQYDPTDVVLSLEMRGLGLPEEVCDLMVGLAGDITQQIVYLPWEANGQFTGRILKKKAAGMIETEVRLKFSELISSILSDGKQIYVANNDLLKNPYYVEGGRLKEFATTVAHIPFGADLSSEIVEQDLFGRFSEKTRSITVLAVRHILAQTKGRAIITAPNALLFGSGAERNLREDLLDRQQIEAVVAMPSGLLEMTSIPFAILILNTAKLCKTVRFVNADTPQFKKSVSRHGVKSPRPYR